jgi:carboxypeptidase family protein
MRVSRRLVLAVLLVGFLSVQLFAQGGATGAITGAVTDPTGAVVANAAVKVTNQETGVLTRSVTTDANGNFSVNLLPPGTYTVALHAAGFADTEIRDIAVRVTETTRFTAKLRPQAVQEKVEVQALVQAVETTTASTGQAIEASTVRALPLSTQNFQQLLTLSTGAQSDLNASAQLGRGNVRIIVNGQREDNNNYLIEGISATDYNVAQSTNVPLPNPDTIQEFKVQTSLYDASQGRNGGGNVNAILKSGSRTFHGDLYEFFRNDVLNANEFFLNRAGLARPPVKQNIFGGSLSGPVGKEGKAGFFFVNYQGTRQRSGLSPGTLISTTLPLLPTDRSPSNLATVFGLPSVDPVISNTGGTGLLQLTGTQFPNADGFLIPSGVAASDCTVGCTPGLTGGNVNTGSYIVTRPGRFRDDQFTANWDREFRGGDDKLSVRFFFSNAESLLPFGAGGLQLSLGGTLQSAVSATDLNFPYFLPVNARFLSVGETHLFSPRVVNDLRFGYVRINNNLSNVPPVTAGDLGIDRPTNSVTDSIYKFTLGSSGFQIGPTPPADQTQVQNNFSFVDNLSWVRGSHSLRFGGEYTRVSLNKDFPQVFNGQLFFVNGGGLTDFQKFLMGAPDFSFGGGGVFNHEYRTNDFAFFGQDDWKVRQDFTLNLGLRVEILGAFHDNLCHIGNLDPDLAAAGQYPFIYGGCVKDLGVSGLNPTGSNTTYKNDYTTGIGPRVGFAWDVFGHHTTSIRGGYGIYFVREDVGTVDQLSFQAPFLPVAFGPGAPGCLGSFFSANVLPGCPSPNFNALPQAGVIDPNFIPCLATFQGFPGNDTTQAANYACSGPGIPSTGIFGLVVPRRFVAPNTQQWNFTVQRELGKQFILEVGYVGSHAIHLRETRTSLQARRASVADPIVLTDANGVQSPPITTNTFANAVARSVVQGINGYSGMQLFADDAYSHYHSLQATLSRRWGAGYFQAAYTFSRSTDATSSGNTALNTAFNDESDINSSRGLSDFDRPHRFVVSYRYELPIFKSATGAKGALLKDWAVSGITTFQTGIPFSVTDSGAGTAFLGPGLTPLTLGASLAPGGSISAGKTSGDIHDRLDGYLNLANFSAAPLLDPVACASDPSGNFCVTDFGDLRRNIYRGPRQQNWDFSLIKNFRLTERQAIRFTAEFFNIFNHPNFGNPAQADVENPGAFGKIVQTVGTPRLIQFSLKWSF